MKFTLDRQSLETFNKERKIVVEGLYHPDKIYELNREIDKLLSDKKIDKRDEAMKFGHDLFRLSEPIKKSLNLQAIGKVIYELISVKPLRLASDQLFEGAKNTFDKERQSAFLSESASLESKSCITETVMGVLIALKTVEDAEDNAIFSKIPGQVTFFGPEIVFPYDFIKNKLNERYLLLTFSTAYAQYVFEEKDPQNHYLKGLGYVFGDTLKDSLHPLIFR